MAKKDDTTNIERKDKYTFSELLDLTISLGIVKYSDAKKKNVDVTDKFVEDYGGKHIQAMLINRTLTTQGEKPYKVSDVMLVTYVDELLDKLNQTDNEALGDGLYRLLSSFPKMKSLASTVQLVEGLSMDEAVAKLKELGYTDNTSSKKHKTKKEHLSYIG
jgi:hypothetical protein